MRLWDKGIATDELILRFTVGDDYRLDQRLVHFDIRASQAHARMLGQCGYLDPGEVDLLVNCLADLGDEHARGVWSISLEEEDAHTAIENRLVARLGELGGKIHLGRSRNDQVLVALRLYLLDALEDILSGIEPVIASLDGVAERQGIIAIPGYTHLQRAMPSTVALWAGAFSSELAANRGLFEAARGMLSQNPLGSAAGYGTPGLTLDREQTTRELGFFATQEPVTAAQLSRGKGEAALAFACVVVLQDLGRLAADVCLYASQEFGFVRLDPAFTTGSSIMPQKRNPDVFELIRGASGQAPAALLALLAITAKMTSGYHRDVQLMKKPVFELVDQTLSILEISGRAITGLTFDAEKTAVAMTPDLFAAERAFELVKSKGISFREAYQVVAGEFKSL